MGQPKAWRLPQLPGHLEIATDLAVRPPAWPEGHCMLYLTHDINHPIYCSFDLESQINCEFPKQLVGRVQRLLKVHQSSSEEWAQQQKKKRQAMRRATSMPKRSRGRVAREPGAKAESEAEADADDDDESAAAAEDAQSAHNTDNEEPQSQDDC